MGEENVRDESREHWSKQSQPIVSTDDGRVRDRRAMQLPNAESPISRNFDPDKNEMV
jgi:hypothetical protein